MARKSSTKHRAVTRGGASPNSTARRPTDLRRGVDLLRGDGLAREARSEAECGTKAMPPWLRRSRSDCASSVTVLASGPSPAENRSKTHQGSRVAGATLGLITIGFPGVPVPRRMAINSAELNAVRAHSWASRSPRSSSLGGEDLEHARRTRVAHTGRMVESASPRRPPAIRSFASQGRPANRPFPHSGRLLGGDTFAACRISAGWTDFAPGSNLTWIRWYRFDPTIDEGYLKTYGCQNERALTRSRVVLRSHGPRLRS